MYNLNDQETFKKKLKEIERQNEAFSREKQKLFDELGVTPEEIHQALTNPSQYSAGDWETLQSIRHQMDAVMKRELENVRNPEKTKKNFENRNLPPWALFCR